MTTPPSRDLDPQGWGGLARSPAAWVLAGVAAFLDPAVAPAAAAQGKAETSATTQIAEPGGVTILTDGSGRLLALQPGITFTVSADRDSAQVRIPGFVAISPAPIDGEAASHSETGARILTGITAGQEAVSVSISGQDATGPAETGRERAVVLAQFN